MINLTRFNRTHTTPSLELIRMFFFTLKIRTFLFLKVLSFNLQIWRLQSGRKGGLDLTSQPKSQYNKTGLIQRVCNQIVVLEWYQKCLSYNKLISQGLFIFCGKYFYFYYLSNSFQLIWSTSSLKAPETCLANKLIVWDIRTLDT